MKKLTIGVAVAANAAELGGDRAQELSAALCESLRRNGLDYIPAERVIWNSADALSVTRRFNAAGVDLVALIHASWLMDNIQYLVYNSSACPVVLLSVPYIETFSMASVQHFAATLRRSGKFCRTISAPLESDEAALALKDAALGAAAAKAVRNAVVGSIGPRQTWRTAGAQDMTYDEWDLTNKFGALVVHIENSEWRETIAAQSDEAAARVLAELKADGRLKLELSDEHLILSCKSYLAIKALRDKYGLTCAAAQCYPEFGGMSNLAACLLADEGFVLDTEGDISHALMMTALNTMDGKASALCECGTVDDANGVLYLSHEGSTALSKLPAGGTAYIQECGEGVMIGFLLRGDSELTVLDFSGQAGRYRSVVTRASLAQCPDSALVDNLYRFTAALRPRCLPSELYSRLIAAGSDHHFILKSGDLTGAISAMNDLLGVETIAL